ncbi:uncharacterized protein LOC108326897 [Vigna angularis]|uniref:uncharacterized protein LOC108326897 n=1 Tax=Phaseolus angularis TaxID=3914 RepID=UPI000809A6FC|nr:uncharacterized protein LOC108326897 [Vigna angularis]
MASISPIPRKSEFVLDCVHVTCNDKCISVTNGFYESFETRLFRSSLQGRKIGINSLESRIEIVDLEAERFTSFLNKKKADVNQSDDKMKNKDGDLPSTDLIMMAKSETTKASLEQEAKESMWYLNSRCACHVTGDPTKFTSLSHRTTGHVTYGDNNKGKTISIGKIQTPLTYEIENVLLVEEMGISHNFSALADENWMMAMQEELNQFKRNKLWELVPRVKTQQVIGTKWVFRNKMDDSSEIIKNKEKLVAKGYSQEEGIDYNETYAPVGRLEAIRILLAIALVMRFKLYQMDVRSAFLNGYIKEEVFIEQPPSFHDYEYPDHVFKLKKALYGLKLTPRSWYGRLSKFLIKEEFTRGKLDSTLFIKKLWKG